MIQELSIEYVKVLIILFNMIIFHEAGHYIFLKAHTKNIKFQIKPKFGLAYSCKLSKDQEVRMIVAGVAMGFVPLILAINMHNLFFLTTLLLYIWGCIPDIKKINKIGLQLKEKD